MPGFHYDSYPTSSALPHDRPGTTRFDSRMVTMQRSPSVTRNQFLTEAPTMLVSSSCCHATISISSQSRNRSCPTVEPLVDATVIMVQKTEHGYDKAHSKFTCAGRHKERPGIITLLLFLNNFTG